MTNQEIGAQVANTFSEAFQAMARMPDVEKELAYYKARSEHHEATIDAYLAKMHDYEAQIAKLEADLAQATKSAEGHKSHVDLMLDEVRKAVGQLAVLTDIVDPRPVEESKPTPQAGVGTATGNHEGAQGYIDLPRKYENGGFTHGSHELDADAEKLRSMGADPGPTLVDIIQSPFVPETSQSGSEPEPLAQSGGQSEVGPTGPIDSQSSNPVQDASPTKSDPKPYWLKPSNMTWADWKDLGNDVPYWAEDNDLMQTA